MPSAAALPRLAAGVFVGQRLSLLLKLLSHSVHHVDEKLIAFKENLPFTRVALMLLRLFVRGDLCFLKVVLLFSFHTS
jgi:hypothetical protein